MGNNSTITIVKPIESFSFYYEIQRTRFVSEKRISVIERIIDFEPDALKYIKIECSQCQFPVAIGFKIGGALEEGIEYCNYKRLSWTSKFTKLELESLSTLSRTNIIKINDGKYSLRFKFSEVEDKVVELLYNRCSHCNSEYIMLYAEVGKHKNWEHIGDIYVHGIWQVELSPEFRENHFKIL